MKRLQQSKTNVLGVVTNARRPKGEASGAYAYGYGRARLDPGTYSGYGALDPASAYAYYEGGGHGAADEVDEPKPALQAIWNRIRGARLEELLQSFNRWLDG
jgi:hypothetical protein